MDRPTNLPRWLYGLGFLALTFFVLPTSSLFLQTPWTEFFSVASDQKLLAAFQLSIVVSGAAAILAGLLGIPLAITLTSFSGRLSSTLRTLVLIPLVLPPVATGIGLLAAFGRHGTLGRVFGFGIANTTAAAVIASTIVSMPFLVLSVEGALRSADAEYTAVASSLGASPNQKVRYVTLPLIQRSIVAGLVLAWARAMGEFGATITFAGNISGVTRTMPLQIALSLEQDRDQALVLSVVTAAISFIVLFVLRNEWSTSISNRR